MAIVEHTGFEHGGITGWEYTASASVIPATQENSDAEVSTGDRAFHVLLNNNDRWIRSDLYPYTRAAAGDAMSLGLSFYCSSIIFDEFLIVIGCDGSSVGNAYLSLDMTTDGGFNFGLGDQVDDATDNLLYSGGAGSIQAGAWNTVEMFWEPDTSSGTVVLVLNGAELYRGTGIDTWPTSGSPAVDWGTYIEIDNSTTSSDVYFDDFFAAQGEADVIGPIGHVARFPSGDVETDPTPVGSATHFENIDEVPPSDTDYNDFDTVGDRGVYDTAGTAALGDILAVSLWTTAHDPVGGATIVPMIIEGGTETDGDAIPLTTAPLTQSVATFETNPRTGLAWTAGDESGIDIGVRRTV